jgi:hypothetical protein
MSGVGAEGVGQHPPGTWQTPDRKRKDAHVLCVYHCFHCCLQEKKKRDTGMQSRGKSTVEEEKRIARQFGVYSGFD